MHPFRSLYCNTCTTLRRHGASIHTGNTVMNDKPRGQLVDQFLNLEQLDANLFRSTHLVSKIVPNAVYGGQVIAHALVAASKTVPESQHPHSLHGYFLRAATTAAPILYHVERVRDGKSFSTRDIKAVQEGKNIFCCLLSFHKDEPNSVSHQDLMPEVPPPEELRDAADLMQDLLKTDEISETMRSNLVYRMANENLTFFLRPVEPESFLAVKSKAPKQFVWVKAKEVIGHDARLQLCAATYMSDYAMMFTIMMRATATGVKIGMATSLDHSVWFHRNNLCIDDWLLYESNSSVACNSRGFAMGRLWTRNGDLVMSTAQEGLVRAKL